MMEETPGRLEGNLPRRLSTKRKPAGTREARRRVFLASLPNKENNRLTPSSCKWWRSPYGPGVNNRPTAHRGVVSRGLYPFVFVTLNQYYRPIAAALMRYPVSLHTTVLVHLVRGGDMDEGAKNWRERAADIRRIARGTADARTRESLLALANEYLELARCIKEREAKEH
jgi:hypothetical protein